MKIKISQVLDGFPSQSTCNPEIEWTKLLRLSLLSAFFLSLRTFPLNNDALQSQLDKSSWEGCTT